MQSIKPTLNDILAGRGAEVNNHEGNKLFRGIVAKYKMDYALSCHRTKKELLVDQVICEVRQVGGRFLAQKKISELGVLRNKVWVELTRDEVFRKVSQCLREGQQKLRSDLVSDNSETSNSSYKRSYGDSCSVTSSYDDAETATTLGYCKTHDEQGGKESYKKKRVRFEDSTDVEMINFETAVSTGACITKNEFNELVEVAKNSLKEKALALVKLRAILAKREAVLISKELKLEERMEKLNEKEVLFNKVVKDQLQAIHKALMSAGINNTSQYDMQWGCHKCEDEHPIYSNCA
jgi:hypothetical protein